MMFWLWWIGFLFTEGLVDPRNEQGFWQSTLRCMIWPVELGRWVCNKTKTEGKRK